MYREKQLLERQLSEVVEDRERVTAQYHDVFEKVKSGSAGIT